MILISVLLPRGDVPIRQNKVLYYYKVYW